MIKKAGMIFFLSACFLSRVDSLYDRDRHQEGTEQDKLGIILKKAGEYCARLNRISLYFVCMEDVQEKIYIPYQSQRENVWRTEVNDFVYDYQLIRKDSFEEKRTLVSENGKPTNMMNAPLKTQRFEYRHAVFGPAGLFGFEAQDLHSYSIEKETKLWGKPAFVVTVVPKNPEGAKSRLYGKAWLDQSDGSVMKIEWEETSVGNYKTILDFAEEINASPVFKFDTEYEFEKNGIRFPSRCTVKEDYVRAISEGFLRKSQLNVKYRDYKFFTVETEVKQK